MSSWKLCFNYVWLFSNDMQAVIEGDLIAIYVQETNLR